MGSKRKYDINGWYEIKDNPLSRVGVFQYPGSVIDFNGEFGLDPNKLYNVFRSKEELSNPETIESFKLVPWINNHVMLGKEPGMMKVDEKGISGVVGESIYFDDNDLKLKGNIKVFGEELENEIDNGKKELSLGYKCIYEKKSGSFNGQQYDFVQRCIRGNHMALVDQGRMGPEVAVLDSNLLTFTIDSKEFIKIMTLEEMEKALAELMKTVSALTEKVDSLAKPAEDEDPEKKPEEEKPAEDEDPEKKPEEEKPAEDEDPEKKPEESKDECGTGKAMDSLQKQIKTLTSTVDSLRKDATKMIMSEISKKNNLAEKVSVHIGTFDHSEMTLREVAVYAAKKLGLHCDKGTELATLNGFLHNRNNVATLDSKTPVKMESLDNYIDGK